MWCGGGCMWVSMCVRTCVCGCVVCACACACVHARVGVCMHVLCVCSICTHPLIHPALALSLPPSVHRFLRHVPVIYVDYPASLSLKQIYGTFNRAMLRLVPNLRAYAEPITDAMVDFYTVSQVGARVCRLGLVSVGWGLCL